MNKERARRVMERKGLDCLVATSRENVHYSTGFDSFLKQVNPLTPVFGVWSGEGSGAPTLVTSYSESDAVVAGRIGAESVRLYGSFPLVLSEKGLSPIEKELLELCRLGASPDPVSAVASALRDAGADSSRIGIDETGLPYGMLEKIRAALKEAKSVEPAAAVFREIRSVKTEEEISKLREVVRVTEGAMKGSMELAKPGSTTSKIVQAVNEFEVAEGARPTFTVVGSRNIGAFPNAPGDDEVLRSGDLVRYDVGCNLNGYCSDLGRTLAIGRPPAQVSRLYRATLAGLEAALDQVRAGVKASEIFRTAVNEVRSRGIKHYQRHHVGHGIGMEVYDPPSISETDDTVLEEGMVINLETPYYELGVGGLIVEDCLVVRGRGYDLLSKLSRRLSR
ncbi:MAG: aminopeptidase P family protein [Nitrososphaerota archaeon]|nr:aminopeptidase P family protein [Nitrososphaerota archaeon]